jgi:tetratricopeptide (TPR) repeat protein
LPTRIEMLETFVTQNPRDPFPRYGLAIEYKNGGRLDDAAKAFEDLIRDFPDYTPAYLHAGNTLRALRRRDDALRTYRAGIEACGRKGDHHARGEIESALADTELEQEPDVG